MISNADVLPLVDDVIAANMDPEALSESCLDKLVATTYVSNVDEPTLSIIVPVLMRGLRYKSQPRPIKPNTIQPQPDSAPRHPTSSHPIPSHPIK